MNPLLLVLVALVGLTFDAWLIGRETDQKQIDHFSHLTKKKTQSFAFRAESVEDLLRVFYGLFYVFPVSILAPIILIVYGRENPR